MDINFMEKGKKYDFDGSRYSTHNRIISLLPRFRGKILDVGCHSGYIGRYYTGEALFYGIDNDSEAIKYAASCYEYIATIDLNKSFNLPWETTFDCLIFGDILEHLYYPEKVLEYFIRNHLKTDGCVIISLPNICNLFIRVSILMGKFNYKDCGILDRTHLHFYTMKTAIDFAQNAGLSVLRVFAGASKLGMVTEFFPFTKSLLATSIVLLCKK